MRRLRPNTVPRTGILVCSFWLAISFLFPFSVFSRSYEVQFFTVNVHGKLDYVRLQRMGVDKVLFRVFQDTEESGGLYFKNNQFRTIKPALENLIAEFDFNRLRLCAWMIGRKFKWIDRPLLFDYEYENGERRQVPKLDVFNPEAIQKILAVFKELASKKIDCILIQDDFILRYKEGFSNWGKAQFSSILRVPARESLMMDTGTPYNENWNRVKMNQLNMILKLIVRDCKMVNSGIKVGINIYYETPVFIKKAEAWYGHNLREIVDTGVDYIYLMSYQRQIKDEMNLNEARNRELFKEIVEKAFAVCKEKLIVKIQVRDWKTGQRVPVEEVRAYLDLVPDGVQRVCFTPVSPNDYDYLEKIIGTDKGTAVQHKVKGHEEKKEKGK